MKLLRTLICAALCLAAMAPAFAAGGGGSAHVRALLIVASNERGESDRELAPYVENLKRILRFESFHLVAEGSASVAPGAEAAIDLARGNRIELANDGGVVRATWMSGGRKVASVARERGKLSVMGGPASGKQGEVSAVIIVSE